MAKPPINIPSGILDVDLNLLGHQGCEDHPVIANWETPKKRG